MGSRQYKATPPLETINHAREILKKLGVFTIEHHYRKEGLYYSCRILIANDNLQVIDVGTNGKGMTIEYALASAYGELMERIQNRMFFKDIFFAIKDSNSKHKQQADFISILKQNRLVLDFRYYPDERKYILGSIQELVSQISIYMPSAYHPVEEQNLLLAMTNDGIGKMQIPLLEAVYYNVNKKVCEYLPFQLIRLSSSSTGMCAGNTPEEAILQGINEIFERYVLQRIYIDKITPPQIPATHYSNSKILDKLELLRIIHGINYEIKDCSLGKGFPVIGLLLIDTRNNKYTFRLGAAANSIIALERCYTEIFQGIQELNNIQFNDIDFNISGINYEAEYEKNVVNGTGIFPEELFLDTPSYQFKESSWKMYENDKEELDAYCDFIAEQGYTLYVRDNSFLNFPAYHVYIPGLSDVSYALFRLMSLVGRVFSYDVSIHGYIPLQYQIKSLDEDGLKRLLQSVEQQKDSHFIKLVPYNTSPHNRINRNLLLSLLYVRLGDYLNAFQNMRSYLLYTKSHGVQIETYYFALRDYYYWMYKLNNQSTYIQPILKKLYGEQLSKEVVNDMKNKDEVFKNFKFPNCFNCSTCQSANQCKFFDILRIEARIQQRYNENQPQQEKLNKVFHFNKQTI
ncbi:ribosomal protein S12 methylthiotransferase accessory factor [Parabacteroides sp. PF5-5]|uniref:YcaO-like family protein n=1 Tax=unclassified Parabacteroides TaxID=2649774 RepID=UPI00247518F8|nr:MULTISPECIES: YcaO-like family protein [unclassified Parabacteroides]MDH6305894.1 ribosomal protein S12 methylthiotransferase accessory factor [Parabacteroides sp. PH5-39]MDH6317293.1 ribosomal protein S12 methylthiotransferase accessory factor [Parabacteroides sp. PF5-13]MDH6320501.1 ribosomal protein S12 methylthiotransferase accessory factor [Parabacteroides sp. PH5-13]MDH6324337.1 ribosomal protein S12 methylthiotransferase accessory factor [Parabacteroides sp. PH5-8]MDH6328533.1 riboso